MRTALRAFPAFSLAAAVVVAVACVGSYRAGFELSRTRYGRSAFTAVDGTHDKVTFVDGRLTLVRVSTHRLGELQPDRGWSFARAAADGPRVAGVAWLPQSFGLVMGKLSVEGKDTISSVRHVELPLPTLAIACLAPSAARTWRRAAAARARRAVGRCGTCGYDLRATPDRCPECGTVVATGPAA